MYISKYQSSKKIKHNVVEQSVFRFACALGVLMFLQFFVQQSWAQVVVDGKLENAEILIGEQTKLTTKVTVNNGQHVEFPEYASGDTLVNGVEVVRVGGIDTTFLAGKTRMQLSRECIITSFDSALYSIPYVEAVVDGKTFRSNMPMGLKVNTVEVDTVHVDKFSMPFDVVEAPYVWSNNMFLLGVGLWIFIGIVFLMAIKLSKRKPKRKKVVVLPPVPPYKKAVDALTQIEKNLNLEMSKEENKQYFVDLTDIVRRFICERFGIKAAELTTWELMNQLESVIDDTPKRQLKDLLEMADFVKFAKYPTTVQQRRYQYEQTLDFLKSTRDEAMEQPKPVVKYVTYTDVQQHRLRLCYWGIMTTSFVLVLALFVWILTDIMSVYL